jgi:uncharacterized membrane protein
MERERWEKGKALVKLLIPFGILGAVVLLFWFFVEPEMYQNYATVLGGYSLVPFSWVAIAGGLGLGIPPLNLIFFIIFADAVSSLFLVWNLDYAKRIPCIGKLIERAEENGEKAIRKYKWVKRRRFIGLILFVMIPISWTGPAVGSIIGLIIGMTPLLTWLAVVIGSSLRSVLFTTLIYIGVLTLG